MCCTKFIYFIATLFATFGTITTKILESQCSNFENCSGSRKDSFEEVQESLIDLDIGPLIRLVQRSGIANPLSHPLNAQETHFIRDFKREAKNPTNRHVSKAIVPPIPPSRPFSAGIFQDGNDYTYFGEVFLGSRSSKVYMLLDTGADSSWVMGSECKDPICTSRDTFGGQNSSTFEVSDTKFSVNYGSGSCSGVLAKDTVNFAGFSFRMPFGVATMVSKEFDSFEIYGILGLSFSKSKTPSFVDSVVASKSLERNLFGISLSQTKDGNNTGVINFGSPDTSRFSGDLKYYPLSGNKNDWKIDLGAAGFGEEQITMNRTTLFDTGATNIFAPLEITNMIYSNVPGAGSKDNGSNWQVPCDTTVNLVFRFGSDEYTLPPAMWVGPPTTTDGQCWSNLSGTDQTNGEWVLGDFFLKNYYVVFDIDKRRIGIANVKIPTPSTVPSPYITDDDSFLSPTEDGGLISSGSPPSPKASLISPKTSASINLQTSNILLYSLFISFGSTVLKAIS